MEQCPFCEHPIDDVIARFGGLCPGCFGEVPGEEAATDPGAAPAESPAGRWVRGMFLVTGAVVVSLSLVILAGVTVRLTARSAPTEVMDFDDWPMPEVVAVSDGTPPTPDEPRSTRSGGAEAFVRGEAALEAAADARTALAIPSPAASHRRRGQRRLEGAKRSSDLPSSPGVVASTPAVASLDLSIAGGRVERDDNVVLDDPLAIRMMIGERLRRGIAELRGCYDRRLKQRPDLAGRWRLTFTVSPDGRATDAALDGLDERDPALEGCLRDHVVGRWEFARVVEATEVSKTLSFHVGR